MLGLVLAAPAILDREFPREVRAEAGNPMYNHYRCQDDRWIAIAHAQPNRYWPKVCAALGLDQLVEDPRFGTIEARGKNAKELVSLFDKRFATKPRHEWLKLFGEGAAFAPPCRLLQKSVTIPRHWQMSTLYMLIILNTAEPRWLDFLGNLVIRLLRAGFRHRNWGNTRTRYSRISGTMPSKWLT